MKRKGHIVLRYLAALAVTILILAPVPWLFLMGVSIAADLARASLEWLPRQWNFSRYGHLLSLAPGKPGVSFLPALGNNLLVAAGTTLVSLLLTVPAAFSFSRYPGRGGRLYTGLGIYMVSPVVPVLSLYFILEHFGLLNTRSGLVLVYYSLIVPSLTWMVKNQFDTPPQGIEQTARLDGLCIWQVLLRIILSLTKPVLDVTALFSWLLAWDEFFYALLFTSNLVTQALPMTIAGFTAGRATDDGLVAAVGILASIPPLLIAIWL